ncbi:hydrogenase expression/formation protein [uncultured Piscinibacter sp.]|uniref:hydrogenase expression/formation protein n=1 Tax=uncultured Piscinibacter sp. TaxID=1131835 RepID=UPI00261F27BE|nr:hydrogenase expression/formation protein [uncultured Piscinibacter sp.]
MNATQRPFRIPVVAALGPGSQEEDEQLDYMSMPSGMETYRPPLLPEPEALAGHALAREVLAAVLEAVTTACQGGRPAPIRLDGLPPEELALVNQVLGEGEVGAQVLARPETRQFGDDAVRVRVQESVFAGVWRVVAIDDDGALRDRIEVGAIPAVLLDAAREDASAPRVPPQPLPDGLVNVPSLLFELAEQRARWAPGHDAHVVNLTLLPLVADDIAHIDHQLGTGRVLILSRGYGNCRISNTLAENTWRLVYYNSQDKVILNAIEVSAVPEVACAAAEDLADTQQRLGEVLQWVMQP